ncbi:MAG: sigma-70 family RNA polymerase sigma factor [Opitutaceae bacterium]
MEPGQSFESQFISWLREHRNILLKVAGSFASETAEQADLFQDMAIELWRSMPNFKGQSKPSTWIYRLCLNTALTWQRSEQKRRQSHSPLDLIPELSCSSPLPGRLQEEAEIMQRLYQAVRALPVAERSLVVLLLDGLSYREISEITGLTENHVGVALTRTRKKLSEYLKEVRREI